MKLINICLAGLLLSAACKKVEVDRVFDQTVDERLSAIMKADSSFLVGSTNGWKAVLTPGNGKGAYFFYLKFTPDGFVEMVTDFKSATATQSGKGTWRMKALQRPSLIFDTYTYIHQLSDPDPAVSGGVTGVGLSTDFEFSVLRSSADSVSMVGNKFGSTMELSKATKAEEDAYLAGGLNALINSSVAFVTANPYLYVQFPDGVKLPFGLNAAGKVLNMQYVNDNKITTLSSTFYFTDNSLHLLTPIVYKNYTFSDIYWDADNSIFYVKVGNDRLDVQPSPTVLTLPLTPGLVTQLGGKYTDIYYASSANQSAIFKSMWDECKTKLAAVGNAGRVFDYLDILFPSATQMQMRYRYHNAANTSWFYGTYTFNMAVNSNGEAKFTFVTQDGNGGVVANGFKVMNDYMINNTFRFEYVANTASAVPMGGLFNVNDPNGFFFGELK